MKVVQTFWSGKGDPLKDSYGWLEPQYHLMSWTLSCLSLKEHYGEVIMYTDSIGHAVFANLLDLPYSDIIVQYDNLNCPKKQWAYAKILTYSLQDKPFIHVDGDVYLPKRLNKDIEKGVLIAQNKEIGTEYYRRMADWILSENPILPKLLHEELQNKSISSYNAGILGGNDLKFIQKYCQTAFDFIKKNQLLDPDKRTKGSHNILFEQILFYTLAKENNKEVTTVLKREIKDNRYSYHDFCNFYFYNKYTLMHLIGGHKRNPKACGLLERTLLKKYPEYYQRIIRLFPQKYKRVELSKKKEFSIRSSIDLINNHLEREVDGLDRDLFIQEKKSCNYLDFMSDSINNKLSTLIRRNPYLSIQEQKSNSNQPITTAHIPTLLNKEFEGIVLDDLGYNILVLLGKEKSVKDILNELYLCFSPRVRQSKKLIFQKVEETLEFLFYNKLIYINTIKN